MADVEASPQGLRRAVNLGMDETVPSFVLDPSLLLSMRTLPVVMDLTRRNELQGAVIPRTFFEHVGERGLNQDVLRFFGGTAAKGEFGSLADMLPRFRELLEYQAPFVREPEMAGAGGFPTLSGSLVHRFPAMVKRLERDLPELLSFYSFPKHLWCSLRTTNVIERCFVEVRRRTRPMVCFVNVESVDRIIFSIFNRFNEDWKNSILRVFTHAA